MDDGRRRTDDGPLVYYKLTLWAFGSGELKMWNLTLKPFRIFWFNFADNLMLKKSSPRNCKMTFIIYRGFADCQILKKWKWPYLLNWVEYYDKLLRTYWYWQDLAQEIANWHFFIGRGFAELQILKKWKWPYLLNCKEYCDEILHTHWYWQDVANEIVKWHLGWVEVLPSSKFWKSENGPISSTVRNIVMKFCIHIDIDKM